MFVVFPFTDNATSGNSQGVGGGSPHYYRLDERYHDGYVITTAKLIFYSATLYLFCIVPLRMKYVRYFYKPFPLPLHEFAQGL